MKSYIERIMLTEQCNLKCSYCYQTNKKHSLLSNELAQKRIEYLNNVISNDDVDFLSINLFGGEPFLNWSVFEMFLDSFENRDNVLISTITNGVLLTDNIIKRLKNANNFELEISMDGILESNRARKFLNDKTTFYIVRDNILKCLYHGLNPIIRLSIGKHNNKYLRDSLIFLKNLGIKKVIIQQIVFNKLTLSNEELKSCLDEIKHLNDDTFQIDLFCKDTQVANDFKDIKLENYLRDDAPKTEWNVFQANGISYTHYSCEPLNLDDSEQYSLGFDCDLEEIGILSITDFNLDEPYTRYSERG